jgi:hypothetical protein
MAKKTAKTVSGEKRSAGSAAPQGGWVVTTSGDRSVADIAKDLSAAGFAVEQTLDQIGIITGKSDPKTIGKARAVRGVADISPETSVDIGPPNSRETW